MYLIISLFRSNAVKTTLYMLMVFLMVALVHVRISVFTTSASAQELIIFTRVHNGAYDIFTMNMDGSNIVNLTNSPQSERSPAWSPDGSKIAFTRTADDGTNVYIMNADGSGIENLTISQGGFSPAWSPDGSKIAFTSYRAGKSDIYVMNADGSNPILLTDRAGTFSEPDWSPSGDEIVFTGVNNTTGLLIENRTEIYVMKADGSDLEQITDFFHAVQSPAWSPDGARIAFYSVEQESDTAHIFTINSDGTHLSNIVGGSTYDIQPIWSPDGSQLLFSQIILDERDGQNQTSTRTLVLANSDGTNRTIIRNSSGAGDPDWRQRPSDFNADSYAFIDSCQNYDVFGTSAGNYYSEPEFTGHIAVGTNKSDSILGSPAPDLILGLGGDDKIWGGNRNDIICGGSGNDNLYGGAYADYLDGGDGEDLLEGGNGDDNLYGGVGQDRLDGGYGFDILIGAAGDDLLNGGPFRDALFGYDGNDTLNGGGWGDRLNGGTGNDILNGNYGNDKLLGRSGNDTLNGGPGSDSCFDNQGSNQQTDCESGTVTAASSAHRQLSSITEDSLPDFDAIRSELLADPEFAESTESIYLPYLMQ